MRSFALTASLAVLAGCPDEAPRDPLDFVPPDAAVVAQAHVQSLVRSSLVRKHLLEREPGNQLGELARACGYDPLRAIERVTIAMVPQGVAAGEFAAVVEGRLDHAKLAACARRLAQDRGETLETVTWSGTKVLRRPGKSGAIALVDEEPKVVLLGEGRLVRAMLRQARVEGRSFRTETDANEVLASLGEDRPVRVVVRPTKALLDPVREVLRGPLAGLAQATVLGLGVSMGARLDVTAIARLPEPAAARRLAKAVEDRVAVAESEPLLDLTGLGGPLRSFAAEARGRDVVAIVSVTERQLGAIAERLRELED